ncbi:MAG: hypothetical protein LKH79_23505 [Heyndrickxia oleronia]|uniref:hypothetical protein n=1 Tax=Heyndrickxia oleronia TaxID=38875 RepID=UPI0024309F23|nr:hypothetical protein [Heyndrickxia oleronia]MCI1593446.1 hypothetical protein [Heyndrickxia oleronia]MCI1614605.1 hypothetical protein [Heyndrickxia oleronia]
MKSVLISSYDRNLDYNHIEYLLKDRLMPYVKFHNKHNKNIAKTNEIKLVYDTYDVNKEKHQENKYIFGEYYISEALLQGFEYSLKKLKGYHFRCDPRVRGHYTVTINHKEYSARNYKKLEPNEELVFLDEEEYNNIELRKMIHLLPESLHWLTLSTGLTIEERENKVREWIKTIIEHVSTLNN